MIRIVIQKKYKSTVIVVIMIQDSMTLLGSSIQVLATKIDYGSQLRWCQGTLVDQRASATLQSVISLASFLH